MPHDGFCLPRYHRGTAASRAGPQKYRKTSEQHPLFNALLRQRRQQEDDEVPCQHEKHNPTLYLAADNECQADEKECEASGPHVVDKSRRYQYRHTHHKPHSVDGEEQYAVPEGTDPEGPVLMKTYFSSVRRTTFHSLGPTPPGYTVSGSEQLQKK